MIAWTFAKDPGGRVDTTKFKSLSRFPLSCSSGHKTIFFPFESSEEQQSTSVKSMDIAYREWEISNKIKGEWKLEKKKKWGSLTKRRILWNLIFWLHKVCTGHKLRFYPLSPCWTRYSFKYAPWFFLGEEEIKKIFFIFSLYQKTKRKTHCIITSLHRVFKDVGSNSFPEHTSRRSCCKLWRERRIDVLFLFPKPTMESLSSSLWE